MSLTLGVTTAKHTLALFREPPTQRAVGFVTIGFDADDGQSLGVGIEEDIDTRLGADAVTYTLRFPKEALGKQWAIALIGSATLSGITVDDFRPQALKATVSSYACSAPGGCQLIRGQTPTTGPLQGTGSDTYCAGKFLTPSAEMVRIRGTGQLSVDRPGDRKGILILPDPPQDNALNDVITDPDTPHVVDDGFQQADTSLCKRVEYDNKWEVATALPTPDYVAAGEVAWASSVTQNELAVDADTPVLTLRRTDLATRQNLGIVKIGIEFALLSGFLPVLLESVLRGLIGLWRRLPWVH
ncbi:MAG: hypothetical protein ACJ74U_13615 [Jatrophihabitantaceae bacterium]